MAESEHAAVDAHAQASSDDPLVGRVVHGKYRVVSLVATGGMGRIYRAEQIPLGRLVALKVLLREGASDRGKGHRHTPSPPTFRQRFFREASVLAKLQHPNVVTVFDYGRLEEGGETDDACFMVMEFLSGETLSELIERKGRLSVDEAITYLRQIALGLRAAHAAGVVHRDLKPSNLMVVAGAEGEPVVKILDFGIIKVLAADEPQDLTQEGVFVGSPRYMAPEQVTGAPVDFRADVYSLGVIAYQLLAGRTPFSGETALQTMMAHVNLPVPPLSNVGSGIDVPEWLERLIERCLEKDPASRPQTVDEVLEALRASATFARASGSGSGSGSHHSMGALLSASRRSSSSEPTVAADSGVGASAPVAARRAWWPWAVALGAVAAGAFGLAALRSQAVVASAGPLPSAPVTAAAPSAPPPVASAPKTFELQIESMPSEATVSRDGRTVGVTPVTVVLDVASVRERPAQFTVSKAGFEAYAFEQGPAEGAVRVRPSLAPAPAARSAAVRPAPARSAPRASAAPSATARPGLDIEVAR